MLTRRFLLKTGAAAAGLFAAGCSPAAEQSDSQGAEAPRPAARPAGVAMIVHRDAGCGCCLAWADLATRAGYDVSVREAPDMAAVKARLGVPEELASCHTAEVGSFVLEGHVPLAAVQRLIADRPAGVIGIAVPGMPRGSPGMEMPDGSVDPFQVIAFDAIGRTRIFA